MVNRMRCVESSPPPGRRSSLWSGTSSLPVFPLVALIIMAACVPAACGSRDERPAAPVFLPYEGPVQTNSIEGVWKGNLRLAGMDHVIVSTITRQEDGWSIVYDNPDMGERGMTASDVRFEGEILRFDIPARGASFLGTLSADGRSIDGGVRMMGRDIPLNLILVSMPDGGERS